MDVGHHVVVSYNRHKCTCCQSSHSAILIWLFNIANIKKEPVRVEGRFVFEINSQKNEFDRL